MPSVAATEKNYEAVLSTDKLKEIVSAIRNEFAFDIEATGKIRWLTALSGSRSALRKKQDTIFLRHSYLGAPEQIGMKGDYGYSCTNF